MKHFLLGFIFFLLGEFGFSQNNALVLNGAFVILNGGTQITPVYFVVNQNSTMGIVRINGHINSEGQYNFVKWNSGINSGNYVFPFGVGGNSADYIPFTFNKTTTSNANISMSTWATNQQNIPHPAISNVAAVSYMTGITDSLTYAIDRFWDIQSPSAVTADLTFSYRGSENTTTVPSDTIKAQHWNGATWDTPVGAGNQGVTTGIGTVGPITGQSTFSPWVLTTVISPLQDTINAFQNVVCNGLCTGTATNTPTGGISPYTYSWNTFPVQTTQTANGLCAGTYIVTVTDAVGNTATASVTITEPPPFTTSIIGTDTICNGNSTTLAASGGGTYLWNTLDSTASITVAPTSSTTYSVTVTNLNGCTATATQTITVNPIPSVIVTPNTATLCSGDSVTLTASGVSSYFWSPSTGLSDSTGSVVSANPIATTTYTVTGTNTISGCTNTQTVIITVVSTITPTTGFSYSTPVCATGTNPVPIPSSGFTSGGTYSSTAGLTINASTGVITLSTSTTGTYTVTYSVVATGCALAGSSTASITINATPTTANAGTNQTVCGTSATLAGNTAISGTGLWTLVSGSGTITTPSSPTSSITGLGAGANVFQWTITNSPCTPSTSTVTITGIAAPTTANAGINQTICGITATLAGNTAITGIGVWTLLSGSGIITTPSSPTSSITGLGIGANVFQWTITNSPCVSSNSTVTITAIAAPTSASAGTNQIICGNTATLAGNTPTSGTGLWTLVSGSGTITTLNSPTSGITGLGVGTNVFQWTITNSSCAPSSSSVTISVTAAPTIASAGTNQIICGNTATLAGNTAISGTGLWTLVSGSGTITTPSSPTSGITGLGVGANIFQWTITNSPCAPSSSTVTITGSVNTTASVSPDVTITQGSSTLLSATGGGNYLWSNGDTTSSITVSPTQITDYCVTVSNLSCSDTACVKVSVDILCGEVFVPNVFSPNDDGQNDQECVLGNCIQSFYFAIYDRWGEKVFETTDQKICWNGTYKGKSLNTAVFVYYLKATLITGEQINKKGNLTLIK